MSFNIFNWKPGVPFAPSSHKWPLGSCLPSSSCCQPGGPKYAHGPYTRHGYWSRFKNSRMLGIWQHKNQTLPNITVSPILKTFSCQSLGMAQHSSLEILAWICSFPRPHGSSMSGLQCTFEAFHGCFRISQSPSRSQTTQNCKSRLLLTKATRSIEVWNAFTIIDNVHPRQSNKAFALSRCVERTPSVVSNGANFWRFLRICQRCIGWNPATQTRAAFPHLSDRT